MYSRFSDSCFFTFLISGFVSLFFEILKLSDFVSIFLFTEIVGLVIEDFLAFIIAIFFGVFLIFVTFFEATFFLVFFAFSH